MQPYLRSQGLDTFGNAGESRGLKVDLGARLGLVLLASPARVLGRLQDLDDLTVYL